MERLPCTPRAVIAAVKQRYRAAVGGLLFYHNQGHYTPGETPAVLWIKPENLQERLGIQIAPLPAPLPPLFPSTPKKRGGGGRRGPRGKGAAASDGGGGSMMVDTASTGMVGHGGLVQQPGAPPTTGLLQMGAVGGGL